MTTTSTTPQSSSTGQAADRRDHARRLGDAHPQPGSPGAERTPPWPRSLVLCIVLALAGLTIASMTLDPMPSRHRALVPAALAIIVPAWLAALAWRRWPRLLLVLAVAGPNIVLGAVGHASANFLFLLLLVAWIAYAGSRAERWAALGLSLAAVGAGALAEATDGMFQLSGWASWSVGIVATWFMAHMLGAQQRLVLGLQRAQADLSRQARELEALHRADALLHRSLRLDEVLQALVDAVTSVLEADKCALMVWDPERERLVVRAARGFRPETIAHMVYAPGEGITGRVFQLGRPIAVEDTQGDPRVTREVSEPEGIRSVLSLPLTVGGEVFRVFGVNYGVPRTVSPDDVRLFQALAQRAELAITNARLYDQAQQAAMLEERQRLARELHDSATQSMYSARMYAEAAHRLLARGDLALASEYLAEVKEAARSALAEMRLLIHELRPPILAEHGLAAALRRRLEAVEARAGIETEFTTEPEALERMPTALEQEVYRLAQEALNNALKHGRPRRIRIRLRQTARAIALEIVDDGAGFDPDQVRLTGGTGLRGMRERAARLGGTVTIDSAPGRGTRVEVAVPR
ncbi:MAG: GAF domain-containing sensor histidine kinase [Sphaerobacter sp.]|nr:GAF domain-containing sensor histidine kinase [Sphaerobacter sp.]